jgi:hypothetical protein
MKELGGVDSVKILDMSLVHIDDESIKTDAQTYIGEDVDAIASASATSDAHAHAPTPTPQNASKSQGPVYTTIQEVEAKDQKSSKHSWSQPGGQLFQVRGKTYLTDGGSKVDSEEQLFQTRGVDLIMTNGFGPINIGSHAGVLGGKLRDKPTFIINFRFPWGVLVYYHEITSKYLPLLRQKYVPSSTTADNFISIDDFIKDDNNNTPHDKAMYNFIMGDDTYRNSKLKLIPKVAEGNIIVRKLVKGKPVIIGKKLPVAYVYEPANMEEGKAEYWEADLDVGSSSAAAKKIVGVCKKYMTSLSVDIGFVIEGSTQSELSERILACTRIQKLDTKLCPILR